MGDDPGSQQILQSLPRGPIDLDPEWVDTETADGLWHVTVRYRWPDRVAPPPEDEIVTTFDTTGGTKRITQSINTVQRIPATATDYKGAIGVDEDLRVKGVDIVVAACSFSETHHRPDAQFTVAYKRTLFQLSGKINNGVFRDWGVGEVLFLGATGSKRGDEKWELTYRFAVAPDEDNILYGDLEPFGKNGWEHVWLRYKPTAVPGDLAPIPVAAYREQVYYFKDFALLDID